MRHIANPSLYSRVKIYDTMSPIDNAVNTFNDDDDDNSTWNKPKMYISYLYLSRPRSQVHAACFGFPSALLLRYHPRALQRIVATEGTTPQTKHAVPISSGRAHKSDCHVKIDHHRLSPPTKLHSRHWWRCDAMQIMTRTFLINWMTAFLGVVNRYTLIGRH